MERYANRVELSYWTAVHGPEKQQPISVLSRQWELGFGFRVYNVCELKLSITAKRIQIGSITSEAVAEEKEILKKSK